MALPDDIVRAAYDRAVRSPDLYPDGFVMVMQLKSGETLTRSLVDRPEGNVVMLTSTVDPSWVRFVAIDSVAVAWTERRPMLDTEAGRRSFAEACRSSGRPPVEPGLGALPQGFHDGAVCGNPLDLSLLAVDWNSVPGQRGLDVLFRVDSDGLRMERGLPGLPSVAARRTGL